MTELTNEHFKQGCDAIRRSTLPARSWAFVFSKAQIKRFISEGEVVDLEKMTVNGMPFVYTSKRLYK